MPATALRLIYCETCCQTPISSYSRERTAPSLPPSAPGGGNGKHPRGRQGGLAAAQPPRRVRRGATHRAVRGPSRAGTSRAQREGGMGGVHGDGAAGLGREEGRPASRGSAEGFAGRITSGAGSVGSGGREKRAREGLVEFLKEDERPHKHIEELTPEDRMGRIRAERARMVGLEARLEKKDR